MSIKDEWFRTWSRVMSITYHARLRLWECGGKRRRSGCRVVRHERERKRNQDFLGRARCGNLLWNRAWNLPERSMSTILSNRINRSLSEVEMIGLRLRSANFIIFKKWVDKVVGQNSSFATGGAKGKNHFWASSTSSSACSDKAGIGRRRLWPLRLCSRL